MATIIDSVKVTKDKDKNAKFEGLSVSVTPKPGEEVVVPKEDFEGLAKVILDETKVTFEKEGDDLVLYLEDGSILRLPGFYALDIEIETIGGEAVDLLEADVDLGGEIEDLSLDSLDLELTLGGEEVASSAPIASAAAPPAAAPLVQDNAQQINAIAPPDNTVDGFISATPVQPGESAVSAAPSAPSITAPSQRPFDPPPFVQSEHVEGFSDGAAYDVNTRIGSPDIAVNILDNDTQGTLTPVDGNIIVLSLDGDGTVADFNAGELFKTYTGVLGDGVVKRDSGEFFFEINDTTAYQEAGLNELLGQEVIPYVINDGVSAVSSITISVLGVNDAPVANAAVDGSNVSIPDQLSVNEDGTNPSFPNIFAGAAGNFTGPGADIDVDLDHQFVTLNDAVDNVNGVAPVGNQVTVIQANGSLTVDTVNNTYTYTPNVVDFFPANENYSINFANGKSFSVTVQPNNPPVGAQQFREIITLSTGNGNTEVASGATSITSSNGVFTYNPITGDWTFNSNEGTTFGQTATAAADATNFGYSNQLTITFQDTALGVQRVENVVVRYDPNNIATPAGPPAGVNEFDAIAGDGPGGDLDGGALDPFEANGTTTLMSGNFDDGSSLVTVDTLTSTNVPANSSQVVEGAFNPASNVNEGTDTITIANHGLEDGQEVTYGHGAVGNNAVGGLTDGANYFVDVSGNSIRLATSAANEMANSFIDLTLAGNEGVAHTFANTTTANGSLLMIAGEHGSITVGIQSGESQYLPLESLPNGTFNDVFTYTITDGTATSAAANINVTVVGVNAAPVLDNTGNPTLTTVIEDTGGPVGAVGDLISNFINGNITDSDSGAVKGAAIVGTDSNGTWHFSIDGGANWTSFTGSTNSAQLLAADADNRIFFQPNANFNGSIASAITFHAWDTTSGVDGMTADLSAVGATGGTTAFSTDAETASIDVSAVNDEPTVSNDGATDTYTEGEGAKVINGGIAFSDDDLNSTNFNGAVLTLNRNGGANADDTFSVQNTGTLQLNGANIEDTANGNAVVASLNTATAGQIAITFTANATQAFVNAIAQNITYSNTVGGVGTTSVQVNYTFDDGNSVGSQATGTQGTESGASNDGSITGTFSTLTFTAVNDEPTVSNDGATDTYTEGEGAKVINGGIAFSDDDLNSTNFNGAVLTLNRNGGANADDTFSVQNTGTLQLNGANIEDTANGNAVVASLNTATAGQIAITFTANATQAFVNAIAQNITYSNSAENNSSGSIQVNYTFDDGNSVGSQATGTQGTESGASNDGSITGTFSTLTFTAVNDEPTVSNDGATDTYTEGEGAKVINGGIAFSDDDLNSTNFNGAVLTLNRNGGANADDTFSVQNYRDSPTQWGKH